MFTERLGWRPSKPWKPKKSSREKCLYIMSNMSSRNIAPAMRWWSEEHQISELYLCSADFLKFLEFRVSGIAIWTLWSIRDTLPPDYNAKRSSVMMLDETLPEKVFTSVTSNGYMSIFIVHSVAELIMKMISCHSAC